MSKNRIEWIDMAKGWGMIFVILGHLHFPYLSTWIYTFHIPLFFFLSGCVFHGYGCGFKEYLIKKVKTIVVPYFCLGIFLPIFFSIQSYFIEKNYDIQTYLDYFKGFLLQKCWFTIWFIACLFVVEILFYWITKICKNNSLIIFIVSVICSAVAMIYYKLGGNTLVWNIDTAFAAMPFFGLGYIFFNSKKIKSFVLEKSRKNIFLFGLFAMGNVGFAYVDLRTGGRILDMSSHTWGFPLFSYASAICGIMCVIMVSNILTIKPIKHLGANSLVYYAWHSRIMIPLLGYLYAAIGVFQGEGIIEKCIYCIVSLILICVILSIPDYIIRHTKLKFMVGIYDKKAGKINEK